MLRFTRRQLRDKDDDIQIIYQNFYFFTREALSDGTDILSLQVVSTLYTGCPEKNGTP